MKFLESILWLRFSLIASININVNWFWFYSNDELMQSWFTKQASRCRVRTIPKDVMITRSFSFVIPVSLESWSWRTSSRGNRFSTFSHSLNTAVSSSIFTNSLVDRCSPITPMRLSRASRSFHRSLLVAIRVESTVRSTTFPTVSLIMLIVP